MKIDRNYILERYDRLVAEKQSVNQHAKNKADKLFLIKQKFPKWLRSMAFHPYNPAYSVFLQTKATKTKKNTITFEQLHPLAVDFFKYCLTHDLNFDTSLYYPKEDESTIVSFIDNRLKSMIPGYASVSLNEDLTEIERKKDALKAATVRKDGGYLLSLDGNEYYLPSDSFQEHTYIHDYGLKYLPDYVKEYIKGKDFLDVGAYLGDTSILLLKKYNPSKIYAYEPVDENAKNVEDTAARNNTDKIAVIQKGVGSKEEELDIFINPLQLSSCSTNSSIAADQTIKKRIKITTIDKECINRKLGLIKMDIEGAEYSAIMGALETIKRDKPVLLISLYHTGKDFFEIPPVLKQAVPDYQFRFMNIEIANPISEKILVAYPPKA